MQWLSSSNKIRCYGLCVSVIRLSHMMCVLAWHDGVLFLWRDGFGQREGLRAVWQQPFFIKSLLEPVQLSLPPQQPLNHTLPPAQVWAVTLFLFRSCHPSLLSFSTTSHTHLLPEKKPFYSSLGHMQFLRQDRLIYMLSCSSNGRAWR